MSERLPPPGFEAVCTRRDAATVVGWFACGWIVACSATARAADPVDYARDIKPLLAQKCFACHGALKQQGGLRLDAAQLLRGGGDTGPVVEPRKVEESELWRRVKGVGNTPRMPPDGEGEHLTDAQLDMVRRWIEEGAATPEAEPVPADPRQHWSYRPAVRPALPNPVHAEWIRTPIDAFVATSLEREGLSPRVAAPREIWLRRVHFDLVGLPPTVEELRAFLADTDPLAEERVVDRLLARPAYGERWGRHWMDVWRYSDWYGSRGINEIRYSQRHIWRWRDWIVESLNVDKPYNRMLTEMVAGDELAPLDPHTLAATGFLGRNWYKFDRNVWMFETVEQTSQAFLGLTFRCARCHDHKFDPVTQEEYYRFRAFFEPHDVRTDPVSANLATEKDATLGEVLKEGLARVFDKDPAVKTHLFQRGDSRYPDESKVLAPGVPAALGGKLDDIVPVSLPAEAWYPALRPEASAALIAAAEVKVTAARKHVSDANGEFAAAENALANWKPAPAEVTSSWLRDDFAARSDETWQVVSGDWTWEGGRLAQKTVTSFATLVTKKNHPRDFRAKVRYRTLKGGTIRSVGFSFDQNGTGDSQDVYTSVNDSAPSIQAFHRAGGAQAYPAAGIVRTPLELEREIVVEVRVRGPLLSIVLDGVPKLDYVMPAPRRDGKFALWVHEGQAEFLEVDIAELVPTREDLAREVAERRLLVELAERDVEIAGAEVEACRARIAAERLRYGAGGGKATDEEIVTSARVAHAAVAKVGWLEERKAEWSAERRLSLLAETTGKIDEANVPPAIAEARGKLATARMAVEAKRVEMETPGETYAPLGATFPPTSGGRRLALAKWLADPHNPRTARIAVNHMWLRHFGQALVPSVANFGLNGDGPSHPELLDWLATELVENGWRMKPLHRMLVLSAAYRQGSSDIAPAAWGSAVADTAAKSEATPVAVDRNNRWLWRMNSRRLEAEAVRDALLATGGMLDTTLGGPEIPEGEGFSILRRSLYFRSTPNERMTLLDTFDAADPNGCYRRKESVVPAQALALMNSPLALDASRAIAESLCGTPTPDDEPNRRVFVRAAFERVLSRAPTDAEVSTCLAYLERVANGPTIEGDKSFPAGPTGRRPPSKDPARRARENLVHVLVNHNEFVTVR